ELTATFGALGDQFGNSVAVGSSKGGATIVVGAPGTKIGANIQQGAAYVFGTPTSVTGISPATGPTAGGTWVTISGTGFVGAAQVDFGTTPATQFMVSWDNQIYAESPPGTGTVNVTVVKPGDTSPINSIDQFTDVSAPVVTGITATS